MSFVIIPQRTLISKQRVNVDIDALMENFGNLSVLVIDNANHTILDSERYDAYVFINLSANRYLYKPTLADNQGRRFIVYNLTGTYKVIGTPEGTDKINDHNATFEITEKGGRLECLALSTHWECTPNENCCIYSVSSETEDAGLSVTSGAWDDVAGMVLTPPVGKFLLDAYGNQCGSDTGLPSYIYLRFGLGTTAGNNAPNIDRTFGDHVGMTGLANSVSAVEHDRIVNNVEFISTGVPVYMKASIFEDETPASLHRMRGATGIPMYISARRIR